MYYKAVNFVPRVLQIVQLVEKLKLGQMATNTHAHTHTQIIKISQFVYYYE